MNKVYLPVLLFIFSAGILQAQTGGYYPAQGICDLTSYQDSNTSVTFYGDSRGDLVDTFHYGYDPSGWSTYLDFGANREP